MKLLPYINHQLLAIVASKATLRGMDKKLSAALASTPEWKSADQALKADSMSAAIELRQFRMPSGEPITIAYKEINADILPQLSSKGRSALFELVRVLSRNTDNTWTYAFTRFELVADDSGGLNLDDNRIKLLALTGKPGVEAFLKKVCDSLGGDSESSRLCGFTGLSWGKPQQKFLLVTVPFEQLAELNQMAGQAGFKISETAPRDSIIDKQTHRARPVEYPTPLFDEAKLFYLAPLRQEAARPKPASKREPRRA